jgi:CRISPR/Cas system-associated protein Cas10 (large subunit of type III CRISPR-Cas system)
MAESKAKPKVPQMIRNFEDALKRDLKPAARFVGRIFVNTWLGDQSFVRDVVRTAETQRKRAAERTAGAVANAKAKESIADAEIVEEPDCKTCGNKRRVGAAGHEVPCPVCRA